MPLDLGQFDLRTASFEIRYPNAFLIWDRSGAVWNEVAKKYSGLKVEEATPNQIRITVEDGIQAILAADRTACIVDEPKSDLRELKEVSDVLVKAVLGQFQISGLSRIGLRLIFNKRFDNRTEAAEFVLNQTGIPVPKGKHLNIEGVILDPEVSFRFEDEELGLTIRLRSQLVSLILPLPMEFRDVAPRALDRTHASLDVDYYTTGITPVDAFDTRALIEAWLHLIRRDLHGVFHG